ncbi:hypothetical protein AMK68_00770 [candidate division KD3-62 bacterium DG_56]|uniref:Uncharacterized protein n=1 Tax=candidate division KD3-62 bacterium DG_56 TaxID=1704032 RepID=A0A0S7XQL7_9BACT|nr:MAG: hypothetical protein AMK68_00770 [candidate division KD3-62 bacterium DG_56]
MIGASLLTGCARSPSTLPPPVRELTMEIAFAEPANWNYYYFFAIDADGDEADGPVPIIGGGPFWTGSWFNGWGIISNTDPPEEPSDYIMYRAGVFQQFHQGTFVGIPFRRSVSDGGRRLSVTIDLDLVTTTINTLDVNFITVDDIIPPQVGMRENYDALGDIGNDYISVPIDYSYQSGVDNSTACAGGSSSCENDQEVKPLDLSLDIVDWSVTVNLPD